MNIGDISGSIRRQGQVECLLKVGIGNARPSGEVEFRRIVVELVYRWTDSWVWIGDWAVDPFDDRVGSGMLAILLSEELDIGRGILG